MEDVNDAIEDDFYQPFHLEEYVDNDEISGAEEGFMVGYMA